MYIPACWNCGLDLRKVLGKLGSIITRSPQFSRAACLIGQGSWERREPQRKRWPAPEVSWRHVCGGGARFQATVGSWRGWCGKQQLTGVKLSPSDAATDRGSVAAPVQSAPVQYVKGLGDGQALVLGLGQNPTSALCPWGPSRNRCSRR